MAYTLKQASEAVGRSKATVLRAIQGGRISATRDPNTQGWLIEPAELHRVYPVADAPVRNGEMMRDATPDATPDSAMLRRELELLRAEREREREDAQQTIADLRRRLDAEAEERRRLTALLAAPASRDNPQIDPPRRRWWWRRG